MCFVRLQNEDGFLYLETFNKKNPLNTNRASKNYQLYFVLLVFYHTSDELKNKTDSA